MGKVIEKGVPIPPKKCGRLDSIAITLRKMEIGDSFECSEKECTNARQTCFRHGIKVTTRAMAKDIYRVWRIA